MVATILVRRIDGKVSVGVVVLRHAEGTSPSRAPAWGRGDGRAFHPRSIDRCSARHDPFPRVGATARIAHFGGGFERGTVLAVHEAGTAVGGAGRGRARCSSSCSAPPPRGSCSPGAPTARGSSCSTARHRRLSAQGALTSGKCSAQCSRSASRTERALVGAGSAEACQQLALALDRRSGDRPAHRQPLEQQLHRPLPGVLLRIGAPARRGPRACGRTRACDPAVSEPRSVSTLPSVVGVVAARSLQLPACAARAYPRCEHRPTGPAPCASACGHPRGSEARRRAPAASARRR